jgi:pyruvate dehydrogenase E2 component (dihydrolipoamide acetyltransferase)
MLITRSNEWSRSWLRSVASSAVGVDRHAVVDVLLEDDLAVLGIERGVELRKGLHRRGQHGEIVFKKYVNVGVAVDTGRGLLVPVIRNVDQKNITQIAIELQVLAGKARDRKLTLDDMSGGGLSLSNLGGLGGTAFTPIVNWPEVAILGVSRGASEPVWRNGAFEPRLMLPLSLSYDHRVIDGADAVRFLRRVVEALEQPFLLALLG